MRQMMLMSLLGLMVLGLTATPIEANFVQCPGGGACGDAEGTTDDADVINGTDLVDDIVAQGGNDLAFGGPGMDDIAGGDGDDFLAGGPGLDVLNGDAGNDILLPGPDEGTFPALQEAFGGTGNDTTNVLVSEISVCLVIADDGGSDTVNLAGFGPYSATVPFGDPALGVGFVFVVDPVTNGFIFIEVDGTSDGGVETINGLLSPDVVIIPNIPPGVCEPLG